MNLEFLHSADFFALLIMFFASMFAVTAVWIMHDLDKDDKKTKHKKIYKIKKA